MKGQISLDEYLEGKKKTFPGCNDCVCRKCLYWWSSRCLYGECYDDHRAKTDPYDAAHPDEPPRKTWSDWEAQQAYWCRGGIFYPVYYCGHFVKYKGQQVKHCLKETVSVFQDGYILCSLADTWGCRRCYEEFEEKMEEPRYLLDKDCVCYGCEFYKHISECDTRMHLGDIDENGGVCDTEEMCIAGNRNTYREE